MAIGWGGEKCLLAQAPVATQWVGTGCHLIELGSSSFLISGQGQGEETEGDSRSFPSISEPRVGPGGHGGGGMQPYWAPLAIRRDSLMPPSPNTNLGQTNGLLLLLEKGLVHPLPPPWTLQPAAGQWGGSRGMSL